MGAPEVLTDRPTQGQPVGLKLTEATSCLNRVGGDAGAPIVCAAIHGILTRQTKASWPDDFDAWCVAEKRSIHVIKKEYAAGPFPLLNFFKNRRLAKGLAAEMSLFSGAQIWFVAHSNGAVIALMAARILIKLGVKVAGVILTGAACESDVEKNQVLYWVGAGQVGKAVAMSSEQDAVVNLAGPLRWLKWPYGDLGRVGWRLNGQPWRTRKVFTLWSTGGHCGYFATERKIETFRLFARLMTEETND